MKRIFTIFFLMMSVGVFAQTYNNEWIDFSKTYYKFKLAADGLYRIPQSVLAGAGLGNTPVQNFQLFYDGKEVPIYTSIPNGIMNSGDYIEFWGQMNDGKMDRPLYRSPNYQHADKWSLETDTSTYFLTVNPSGAFHYNLATNDTTGNVLPAEPYFMYKQGVYYRNQINPGYAQVIGEYIYSSSYDIGEFWSSGFINQGSPFTDVQNNLFVYSGGPASSINFGAVGASDTLRHIKVSVNSSVMKDTVLNGFSDLVSGTVFPTSLINSGTAAVQFANISQATTYADRIVVSFYELNYPRQFNFGGQSNFSFQLPARLSGYYLQIAGFSAGSSSPVLYDKATGQRYNAIVGSGGMLYFLLTGTSNARDMVLVSEDPALIRTVTGLTSKSFVNFNDPANQGNYLIISHPSLYKRKW